jgi:hypothetical protein
MSAMILQSDRVSRKGGKAFGVDHIPASAGTPDQIKVIAGEGHFREFLPILNPPHNLSQYEEFGQSAYTTAIW